MPGGLLSLLEQGLPAWPLTGQAFPRLMLRQPGRVGRVRRARGFKLRDVLLLATGLAVGSYLAFIVLLKLQFPVWPAFLAG